MELFLRGGILVVDDVLEDPRTSPRRALPWDADFLSRFTLAWAIERSFMILGL
jgi:hypothetical protein